MLKREKDVSEKVDALVESIKASNIYNNYLLQKSRVEKEPELKKKIDDFRRENFEVQQNYQGAELDNKIEEFEMRYASFRQNPLVDQFFSAELAFCRMMQEIYTKITAEVDFDMELTGGK